MATERKHADLLKKGVEYGPVMLYYYKLQLYLLLYLYTDYEGFGAN